MKSYFYILEDDEVVGTNDSDKFNKFFCSTSRIIGRDFVDKYIISTVFMGIDHSPDDHSEPLVFETMVFENMNEIEQTRYNFMHEAREGHKDMVAEYEGRCLYLGHRTFG